jgi:hypothetical protein
MKRIRWLFCLLTFSMRIMGFQAWRGYGGLVARAAQQKPGHEAGLFMAGLLL